MSWLELIAVPLISAFIGWSTNVIAVRLLFRPHHPYRLGPWTIQGVIPRRRAELARSVGQVVENDLLSINEITDFLISPAVVTEVSRSLYETLRQRVEERLSLLPLSLRNRLLELADDIIERHLPPLLYDLVAKAGPRIGENLHLAARVEARLNGYPVAKLEEIVLKVMARELRYIEILGGVIGFIIGLVQLLILWRFAG